MLRTVGWIVGQLLAMILALWLAFSLPPKNREAAAAYRARGNKHAPLRGELVQPFLFGGAFLALLAAAWQASKGGEDADLIEAVSQAMPTPLGELRPGMYVAIQGRVTAVDDLLAPRARERVVWYRYLQTEEWKVNNGTGPGIHQERVHAEETEMVPFYVTEGKARVGVAPGQARVEPRRLHREAVGAGGSMTDRGGSHGTPLTKGGYTGHRFVHEVQGLQHDAAVFVMGMVTDGPDGEPRIESGGTDEQPFLVSARPPGELLELLRERAGAGSLIAAGLGVLGLILGAAGMLIPSGALS